MNLDILDYMSMHFDEDTATRARRTGRVGTIFRRPHGPSRAEFQRIRELVEALKSRLTRPADLERLLQRYPWTDAHLSVALTEWVLDLYDQEEEATTPFGRASVRTMLPVLKGAFRDHAVFKDVVTELLFEVMSPERESDAWNYGTASDYSRRLDMISPLVLSGPDLDALTPPDSDDDDEPRMTLRNLLMWAYDEVLELVPNARNREQLESVLQYIQSH